MRGLTGARRPTTQACRKGRGPPSRGSPNRPAAAIVAPVVFTSFLRPASGLARALLVSVTVLGAAGCSAPPRVAVARPVSPTLAAPDIAALLPARARDRLAWAEAIVNGLAANELPVDVPSSCAVIAVIDQESGFEVDPAVPGLAAVAKARVDHFKAKLGPLGDPVVARLLSGRAPQDARSFQRRLDTVRTERDVDVLFRDLLAYYETNHPILFTTAAWAGKLNDRELADLNPVTTAGSMQVSVHFAEEWARSHGGASQVAGVRDALYTRVGGVYYGTARLLGHPDHYDRPIFRFADYNAGIYSSRNAAIQAELVRLTGQPLALDGDLLSYAKDGTPNDAMSATERAFLVFAQRHAPSLSPADVRHDLLTEKTLAFEDTTTYRALVAAARRTGKLPDDAILPQVAITSPKFAGTRSTAWFARSVERRYQACTERAEVARPTR